MKLIKTEISGISYTENKNKSVTYYGNFRHPITRKSTRKKLLSKDKHLKKNLREALDELNKVIEEIKESNNSSIIVNNYGEVQNYSTLNELADSHFSTRKELAITKLKQNHPSIRDEEFFKHAIVKEKMKNLMKDVYSYNKHVRSHKISNIPINKVTEKMKEEFLNNINARLAEKSKFNIFSIVRTIINKAIKRKIITVENIFSNDTTISNPKRKRSRVLNKTQLAYLLKKCKEYKSNPNVFYTVYFAVLTGARSNTILNIRAKDIDVANCAIHLTNFKVKSRRYKQPISESEMQNIRNTILPYYKPDEYILRHCNPNKRKLEPMSRIPDTVYKIMDKYFNKDINKQDNIERDTVLNFHSIRRTVATNLAKDGTSLYNVMIFLNHSNIKQTMDYLNINENDLDKDISSTQESIFGTLEAIMDNPTDYSSPEKSTKNFLKGRDKYTTVEDKIEAEVRFRLEQELIKRGLKEKPTAKEIFHGSTKKNNEYKPFG